MVSIPAWMGPAWMGHRLPPVWRAVTPIRARVLRRMYGALDRVEAHLSPQAAGCRMVDGLYVRANGRLPCWCGPGEAQVHGRVSDGPLLTRPGIERVRAAFSAGQLPAPALCGGCQARRSLPRHRLSGPPRVLDELHLEPSFLCPLGCAMCPADNQTRRAEAEPPYHLTLGTLDTVLSRLRAEGVRHVRQVRLEGKGEPLLNPDLEAIIGRIREAFPATRIVLTTSGSVPQRPSLATSGLDLLTVSADGFWQDSYARYRVRGRIAQVRQFITALRLATLRSRSTLQVVWKYLLFEWNDSPEELAAAWTFCQQQGVAFELRFTHSEGGTQRWTPALLEEHAARFLPGTTVKATFARQQADARAQADGAALRRLGIGG